MLPCRLDSQITFLYFKDLAEAAFFFEDILKLELVDDQGAAKIYRLCGNAFIGIVDEKEGHCRAQEKNAVLITIVAEKVQEWYDYLVSRGVRMETPVQRPESFPVECFFFKGPGGYEFEIQRFLKEETARQFS
ncbi:VOC family protein [Aminivibrio sp.]|uniref:VOC family protein n=1 Tax=Aminivibrio sp. TaxID=1872489 RepID=UPI003D999175